MTAMKIPDTRRPQSDTFSPLIRLFSRSVLCHWVAVILVVICFSAANSGAAERSREFIAFGDSITQGVPETGPPPNGARIGGYEPDLEKLTDARNEHYDVYNYGIGGETTWEGFLRIDSVLAQHPNAKHLLLLEGTNDIWSGISREDTVTLLFWMINEAREYGIEPVLGTLTPDTRGEVGEYKNVPAYNNLIRPMAEENNILLAEFYDAMIADWNAVYASEDLLHPSRAGYERMAQIWFKTIFNCSNGYVDQCLTLAECKSLGGYWYSDMCNAQPLLLNGVLLLLQGN